MVGGGGCESPRKAKSGPGPKGFKHSSQLGPQIGILSLGRPCDNPLGKWVQLDCFSKPSNTLKTMYIYIYIPYTIDILYIENDIFFIFSSRKLMQGAVWQKHHSSALTRGLV